MPETPLIRPAFQPARLLLFAGLALALFGSWAWIDATREAWDALDAWVFFTLNGSLPGHPWWQAFWAIGNNEVYDFIVVILLLAILIRFILADNRAHVTDRASISAFILLVIFTALLLAKTVMAEPRISASLTLSPAFYLSEAVTWLTTKDRSYSSFPGDHATVLWTAAICIWHFMGRRAGLISTGIAVYFILPRLVSGAHWFTDVVAGSGSLALAVSGILLFTPLCGWLVAGLRWLAGKPLPQVGIDILATPETPSLVLKGSCMGTADIIPGVSGGTMAYILGIWHRLIEAIKSFDLAWFRLLAQFKLTEAAKTAHLHFLVPLLLGIVLAVFTFTRLIPLPYLLHHYPEPVYGLFFGLIGASILILLQELGRLTAKEGGILIFGVLLGWLLVTLVPVSTPETAWFVFLCGVVAISAMLLPGISGSFILLILGKYAYILDAIGRLDFGIIGAFIAGCAVGVMGFARLASWLLHRFYRITVLVIIGILTGSLWIIWPFQNRVYETVREKQRLIETHPTWPQGWEGETLLAVALAAVGFAFVMWLHARAQQMRELPVASTPNLK